MQLQGKVGCSAFQEIGVLKVLLHNHIIGSAGCGCRNHSPWPLSWPQEQKSFWRLVGTQWSTQLLELAY